MALTPAPAGALGRDLSALCAVCSTSASSLSQLWGRLRLIATLHDPAVIQKILGRLAPYSEQSAGPVPPEGAAAS